jgi:MFS family permease
LNRGTFQTIVLLSILPGFLAVLSLAVGARDVPVKEVEERPRLGFKGLGKPFLTFLVIIGIFDLGNSSDAFLVLRAQERGLNILGILGMLATFNLVYALVSTPGGSLSDRIGRRKVLIGGWLAYSLVPQDMRGIAYGTYAAVLGILNFPASFLAGVLWQGIGPFEGFGPAGPFIFGGVLALIAAVWMFFWRPPELVGER